MTRKYVAALSLFFICLPFASAEMYKCKGPAGVVYSDKPCALSQKNEAVPAYIKYENSETGRRNSKLNNIDATIRAHEAATRKQSGLSEKCAADLKEYNQHKYSGGQVDLRWLESKKRKLVLDCGVDPARNSSNMEDTNSSAVKNKPSVITNCDGSGCWDNLGGRYNRGAGNTFFGPSGRPCQEIGGQMQCN